MEGSHGGGRGGEGVLNMPDFVHLYFKMGASGSYDMIY